MQIPTLEQARDWYDQQDTVHGYEHIQRVYCLAERLAKAEGADLAIVRAAALLHDADRSLPGEGKRADHHLRAAQFAGEVLAAGGWPPALIEAVQHCIRAHRFRGNNEAPATIEAKVLYDADKLDAIGAIGAVRAVIYAAQAGNPVYSPPSPGFLHNGQYQPGEKHSAYHEYVFKLSRIQDILQTNRGKELAAGRHAFLEQFFLQLAEEVQGQR